MSETEVTRGGLSPDEIVERSAGGLEHRAGLLTELGSTLYATGEEFRYEDTELGNELVRLCDALTEWLTDMSMLPDGSLSEWRECARCSGDGRTAGEEPCIECGGTGAVHRDEASG